MNKLSIPLIFLALLPSSGHSLGQNQMTEANRKKLSEAFKRDLDHHLNKEFYEKSERLQRLIESLDPRMLSRAFGQERYEDAKAKALADIESRQIITPGLDPASIPSFQTLLDIPNKNPPQNGQLYSSQKFSRSPFIIFMTFENGIIQALAFDRLYAFVESNNAGKISDEKTLSSLMAIAGASVEGIDGGGHDYKSVDIAQVWMPS